MKHAEGGLAAALSFLVLAVLDLCRAYVDGPLRGWQWAAGVVFLACLWRWLSARGLRFRELLPWLALAAFLLPTYVDHGRQLQSDGPFYYSYLRSLLIDHDLDLRNDYALLGRRYFPNVFPVGAPILWSPVVALAHAAREAGRLFGLPAPEGIEPLYQASVCLATLLYGSVALFLLFDALRRWAGPAAAFWATVITWVGSPLRFYLSVLPSMAHGVEFFASVLVLRAYLSLRDEPDLRRAALAGGACGLLFLVRPQDGLFLALPGIELSLRLVRRQGRRQAFVALLVVAGTFVLAILPQLAIWQALFGVPVLIPQDAVFRGGFMHFTRPELLATLVSPRGGLLSSHPAMAVAILGLGVLLLRDPRYVLALAPAAVLGWYVNSAAWDWFHAPRRFTGLVPLLAPGLATLLSPLAEAGLPAMAILAFLVLRFDVSVHALRHAPGEPAPVRQVVVELSDGLVADAYGLAERVAPGAAVRLLAAYTGEDLLGDREGRLDLGGEPPLLRLPRRAESLSGPTVEEGIACRWAQNGRAVFYLPLSSRGPLTVALLARRLVTDEPQAVEAVWNGAAVGRRAMEGDWGVYRFEVPGPVARLGTNVLELRFDRAWTYRRVRGEGPRERRSAALAWIDLRSSPPP